jgi:hypothetical protein
MLLIIILTLLSVAAVSADDNSTVIADNPTAHEVATVDDLPENNGENTGELSSSNSTGIVSEEATGEEEPAVNKTPSTITASNVIGYEEFTTTFKVKLTANGTALASKQINIYLDGINYKMYTDSKGVVTLKLLMTKGTYTAQITYLGDDLTSNATGTCKVTIKAPTKTKLKLGDKYINYRQGSKCLFYVKLVDANNKAIKNQIVKFKVAGKTYSVKTNKNGNAKIYLNLKKGTYKIKYSFKKTSPYLASSGSYKIKVKAKMAKGNGYWLWPAHMKSVNLKKLSKKGTKHILLHVQALSVYGKSGVVSFIKKAHKYGMKVHLWMQVCYSGGKWVRPINDNNKIKYSFLNKKIKEAKKYAKIKGVDGIHFDYVRFGGTAHLYKDPNRAINYFMKKSSTQIHKVRPNCIVSAALMPEPSAMTYYYGQDVSTMSKYADALIPMVYKGNYHQTRSWITSVTKAFVSQSNGAQIWTGLQSYHSDDNVKKLSHSTLIKDSKAAMKGGAKGVILFRIGISHYLNFKKV